MTADLIAALAYLATMSLGLTARLRSVRFGNWHHIAYAVCVATFAVAVVISPSISHIVPAAALMIMPFTRPRTSRIHELVAVLGAIGFALLII